MTVLLKSSGHGSGATREPVSLRNTTKNVETLNLPCKNGTWNTKNSVHFVKNDTNLLSMLLCDLLLLAASKPNPTLYRISLDSDWNSSETLWMFPLAIHL